MVLELEMTETECKVRGPYIRSQSVSGKPYRKSVHPLYPNGHITQWWRKDNVFTSSTRRRVDAVKTLLLRRVPAGIDTFVSHIKSYMISSYSYGCIQMNWYTCQRKS